MIVNRDRIMLHNDKTEENGYLNGKVFRDIHFNYENKRSKVFSFR